MVSKGNLLGERHTYHYPCQIEWKVVKHSRPQMGPGTGHGPSRNVRQNKRYANICIF